MIEMVLRGGKNNQYGRNEVRYQFATGDPVLCPVRGLAWIRLSGRIHRTRPWDPVSHIGNGRGVGNGHIVQILKHIAREMGLDESNYSTHSIRIGGSTALLNAGAQPLVIKLLGRWLSDCYQEYPVLLAKGSMGVSKLMCWAQWSGAYGSTTGLGFPSTPHPEQGEPKLRWWIQTCCLPH